MNSHKYLSTLEPPSPRQNQNFLLSLINLLWVSFEAIASVPHQMLKIVSQGQEWLHNYVIWIHMSYEFTCRIRTDTFDSTASGLGAFQILNRNIRSSLRPRQPCSEFWSKLSDHVIVCYNELTTLMNAAVLRGNSSGRRGMTRSRMC